MVKIIYQFKFILGLNPNVYSSCKEKEQFMFKVEIERFG